MNPIKKINVNSACKLFNNTTYYIAKHVAVFSTSVSGANCFAAKMKLAANSMFFKNNNKASYETVHITFSEQR
jgi:hypothetical protein